MFIYCTRLVKSNFSLYINYLYQKIVFLFIRDFLYIKLCGSSDERFRIGHQTHAVVFGRGGNTPYYKIPEYDRFNVVDIDIFKTRTKP